MQTRPGRVTIYSSIEGIGLVCCGRPNMACNICSENCRTMNQTSWGRTFRDWPMCMEMNAIPIVCLNGQIRDLKVPSIQLWRYSRRSTIIIQMFWKAGARIDSASRNYPAAVFEFAFMPLRISYYTWRRLPFVTRSLPCFWFRAPHYNCSRLTLGTNRRQIRL